MNEKQMQEMAVSILLDEYTQLDVAQLLKEYDEAEENGEVPNVPDALDEKCSAMIRREFDKKKYRKAFAQISKVLSRVAVVILALIGLCTVSVLSVKAWRIPVLQFVLESFDRYSAIHIEGEVSQSKKTPEAIIESLANCVPKGYILKLEVIDSGYFQIKYTGTSGEVIYLTGTDQSFDTRFDTEFKEGSRVNINGYDAVFFDRKDYRIMWVDENAGFMLDLRTVNLNKAEFWKIVNSLIQ